MSRETKFRAWDKEEKQMMYFGLRETDGEMLTMQYTDVYIKWDNNKEICVGDLLKVSCEGVVQDGCYEVKDLRSFYERLDTADSYLRITPMKVLGNVWENSELLKGGK